MFLHGSDYRYNGYNPRYFSRMNDQIVKRVAGLTTYKILEAQERLRRDRQHYWFSVFVALIAGIVLHRAYGIWFCR